MLISRPIEVVDLVIASIFCGGGSLFVVLVVRMCVRAHATCVAMIHSDC